MQRKASLIYCLVLFMSPIRYIATRPTLPARPNTPAPSFPADGPKSFDSVSDRRPHLSLQRLSPGRDITRDHADAQQRELNTFGKVGFLSVDAKVDAQPLYVNKQFIDGSLNDTVYVVTENDSVYAFSAASGTQFWQVSVLARARRPATITAAVRSRRRSGSPTPR